MLVISSRKQILLAPAHVLLLLALTTLQYLTWTRPDLSYAVNLVRQHLHQPRSNHLGALLNEFFVISRALLIWVFGLPRVLLICTPSRMLIGQGVPLIGGLLVAGASILVTI
ncbi:unnamed protein product [Prunus brigantina]